MELTTLIVFLIPVVVARHNHRTVLESILKSTDNLYTKLHNDIQNVINNLFDRLNLAPNFPEKSRIKLFFTMYYDLNNMAAKNYDEHIKMIDAARPDTGNRSLSLFKLIEKTLSEKPLNLSVSLHEKKTTTGLDILENTLVQQPATIPIVTPTSLENINSSDPIFADSKEFMQFIKDFMKKVDKLNETYFSKSAPLLPPMEEFSTPPDIEIWQPPTFDYFNDTGPRRIFKSERSAVKSYPFIVSIHLLGTFVCAGSIVASDMVITAASCLQILHNNIFFRESSRSVKVRIGSDYYNREGEVIPVLETFFHPSYNPKTLANNLVLLRLERHIRFFKNQKNLKKIRYDRSKANLSGITDGITVVGWGSRKRSNILEQFERVMVAKLEVYAVDNCAEVYSKKYVTNRHFCAGFVSKGGGACNKDLGGPGIVGGVLVGVISFGAPMCGAVDAPTVFTKLGYYDEWIDSVIKKCDPSFRRRRINNIKIPQLFPYTPTTRHPLLLPIELLRSIFYEDFGMVDEDVSDLFKSTKKFVDVKQHPLANLSLFLIHSTIRPTVDRKPDGFSGMVLTTSDLRPASSEYDDDRYSTPAAHSTHTEKIPDWNGVIDVENDVKNQPEVDLETHYAWGGRNFACDCAHYLTANETLSPGLQAPGILLLRFIGSIVFF